MNKHKKEFNWGFIGASTIARSWMIDAVRQQPGHDVTALLSSDKARGEKFIAEYNIDRAYTMLDNMLADEAIDAVYISTTNELHKDQAVAAAKAGKHVLCEKPLALSLSDAEEIVDACRDNQVILGTNHHLRNSATHSAVRDLIASGRIGKVTSMRIFHAVYLPENLQTWRLDKPEAGGGVILDIVVHDADTVRFILGEDPGEVAALGQSKGMGQGLEDGVMCVMKLPSGILVQSHESFTAPFAGSGLEVHGTHGSIFANGVMTQQAAGEIHIVDDAGRHEVTTGHHNLYARSLAKFARAMCGEGQASATGEDGVKSLAVALAARDSIAQSKIITVDYGALKTEIQDKLKV